MAGPLALVGGDEWRTGCEFDRDLLAASPSTEVLVVPTASAYEHPDRTIAAATAWFETLGATVRALPVLARADAVDHAHVPAIEAAGFIYIGPGSPMHLRSVLKDSPVWEAIVRAWQGGAVLAGSGAGAMVLCDPMVDPRGGALTLGLGLIGPMAVIPQHDTWSDDKRKRTLKIAPATLPVAGIDGRSALVRDVDGSWSQAGVGGVTVFFDGRVADLSILP